MSHPQEIVHDLVTAGKGFLFGMFLSVAVAGGLGYALGARVTKARTIEILIDHGCIEPQGTRETESERKSNWKSSPISSSTVPRPNLGTRP